MTGVFEDHLAPDAIVAYVDGELSHTARARVVAHVSRCGRCAVEVAEQEAVQGYLRSAQLPQMSGSLFDALRSIPVAAPVIRGKIENQPDSAAGGEQLTPQSRSKRFKFPPAALITDRTWLR